MFFYDVSSFVPINNFKCLKYEQTRVGNCWAVVSQPTGKFNPAKIAPCCNSKVQIVLLDFSWRNWFNFCVSGHFFLTSFSINHFDGNIWVEVFPFLTKKSSELKKNLRQLFFSREPWAPIYLDSRKNELWIHEEKSLLGIVIWTKFNLRSEFWKRNSTNEGFKELKMRCTCSQFSLDVPGPFNLLKTFSKMSFLCCARLESLRDFDQSRAWGRLEPLRKLSIADASNW